jgi:hypothetical protein
MKTKKFIAIAALSALATVTLTSCSSTSHNTTTPYGSLYNSLNDTIASANNNEYKLSLKTFYNSLKKNGNQLVTQNIQKAFYHTEYDAISLVLANENYNSLTADEKATLGDALKQLEKRGLSIHPCLKTAFSKLYGYTTDQGGIRHAEGMFESNVTFEEAKFMLVSCSAFINYLIAEYGKRGN